MTTHSERSPTVGVILAGGAAKRLGGGDKGLRMISERSLLSRVTERLAPQCDRLLLSANGDGSRFAAARLTVVPDNIPGLPGPLAGILAALDFVSAAGGAEWLVSAPVDCPFLPLDLVGRLHDARGTAKIVIARSGGRTHPVIGLWHASLRADLYHALAGEDLHKAGAFVARHPHAIAEWDDTPVDPFFNVNSPDDLREAERIAHTTFA